MAKNTEQAKHEIATAASDALKVISNASIEALKITSQKIGNDHDILTTLVADVKNLAKSQSDFHMEMKESIADLKNNYSTRLDNHETRIQNLETTRVDFREKIRNNNGYLKWILLVVGLLFAVMCWHIVGYHI
jgi:uncharacterized protein YpuA (DUF1002 family)